MSNGKYRAIHVNDVEPDFIRNKLKDRSLIAGVDVAKSEMYAGIGTPDGEVHRIITWTHPGQTREAYETMQSWGCGPIEMVLEPTGTYDDPLRYQADQLGWDVYRVSPKRMHDASEVYDGVPSQHDAKAASMLVWLHGQGISSRWSLKAERTRRLTTLTNRSTRQEVQWDRVVGRLEALLARHWPEVIGDWDYASASFLGILQEFGGPKAVRDNRNHVQERMREIGGHWLKQQRINDLLSAAQQTVGVPMTESEREELMRLAERADEIRHEQKRLKTRLTEVIEEKPGYEDVCRLRREVGTPTAAKFRVSVGDFREFEAPKALINAFGLTLKERSSGTKQGQHHITKRGPGEPRQLLYLATLRKIKDDPVFEAWHDKKVAREGGKRKKKSVIALARKYLKGLWHVARGKDFDSRKLFDVSRLKVA